ncbi:dihydrodipicolinate synthase family protein [Methylobacterium indicum]|uniref:Dihydrodipicolinate synthase family protein n=1 Tax=Methylobacterium indicum TaxID=1775910 RepID=A0A8H8WYZ3_9HYPH|nr:dihydrodipicolinate synthase family protein [Methylobacterium indicum]BCM87250.1 dihydrodipicolinate synthase family protein [Methylobacterium indicum]
MTDQVFPRGVFCAALTPLDSDLNPNYSAFTAHCRYLIDEGCTGVALLGTTGEANSFSSDERMRLLEAALAGGVAPAQLMPGTGVAAIPETVALTRHALSVGVTTIVLLPPFYYKGVSEDGLVAAYARIIEGVGDDRLRVVLYHIPQMSGVAIPHGVIAALRERFPGIVTGIKDSSGDLAHMTALVERFPGFSVLAGADPLMLPLLKIGGAGAITATTNLCARDLRFVFDHHADPAKAAEVAAAQARVVATRERASRFPQMASLKALTAARTGDADWHRLRPPLMALTEAERGALLGSGEGLARAS